MNTPIRTRIPAALAGLATLVSATGIVTAAGAPAAAATVTCNSPVWKVQFFANTKFSGTPKKTACDAAISENYGYGHPSGVSLPNDNFSVRWSLTRDFGSGGPFTFAAETQDGIRVYLDGSRKIDLWKDVSSTKKKSVNVTVPKGKHTLRVDFVAWKGKANVKFAYTPRTTASVDKVKPLAPAKPGVSYNGSTNTSTVSWTANKEMDLAGYRVYRRPSPGTTWTKVSGASLVTKTGFADKSAPRTGAKFGYEVRAVDKAGNESAGSTDVYVTTVDKTAPAAPAKPVVFYDGSLNSVTLWWTANKESDLAGYRVYRRPSPGTTWTKVSGASLVTKTTFTDTSAPATGEEVAYEVRAVDKAGNESAGSTDVYVTTADKTGPAAPGGVTVSQDAWMATVSWGPVKDAVRYEVSAAPDAAGPYSVIARTTDTTVLVESRENTPRFYRVQGFDQVGNPSAYSAVFASDGVDRIGPKDSPTNPNAVVRPGTTDVYWSMPGSFFSDWDNGGSYRLYRSPGRTFDKSALTRVTCGEGSGFSNNRGNCNDLTMDQGAYYTYAVAAVDPRGNEGPLSAPLTVRTGDRVAPAPLTGVTATPRADGILLSWDASTADDLDDISPYWVWTGVPQADGTVKWTGSTTCDSVDGARTTVLCKRGVQSEENRVYAVVAKDRWSNRLHPSASGVMIVPVTDPYVRPAQ
ncbi:PA14 domain-containing protein [Streptomyces sp. NPDC046203]|uniref:PA14 domain-containing protein n=1 Tax=Streptomyces sp. NPDC046203 TaxID=3154602 RepID=UPI0033DC1C01